jgi:hypothetical protein
MKVQIDANRGQGQRMTRGRAPRDDAQQVRGADGTAGSWHRQGRRVDLLGGGLPGRCQ